MRNMRADEMNEQHLNQIKGKHSVNSIADRILGGILAVDSNTLSGCPPSERHMLRKLSCLLLIPLSIAGLGSFMALRYQGFEPIACSVGCVGWVTLVYLIDSCLMSKMVRSSSIAAVIFRIILAIAISFASSTTLELYVFDGIVRDELAANNLIEIEKRLSRSRAARIDDQNSIANDEILITLQNDKEMAEKNLQRAQTDLNEARASHSALLDAAAKEAVKGYCGPKCNSLKELANIRENALPQFEAARAQAHTDLASKSAALFSRRDDLSQAIKQHRAEANAMATGLEHQQFDCLTLLRTLWIVIKKDAFVAHLSIIIHIGLLILELLPITLKLGMRFAITDTLQVEHDLQVDANKHLSNALQAARKSDATVRRRSLFAAAHVQLSLIKEYHDLWHIEDLIDHPENIDTLKSELNDIIISTLYETIKCEARSNLPPPSSTTEESRSRAR